MKKGIFVAFEGSLGSSQGGQQVCTKELRTILEKAGYQLENIIVKNRLSLPQRVANRVRPLAYPVRWPSKLGHKVSLAIRQTKADAVFFNLIDFLPLASQIRENIGSSVQLVMLSHGLASADVLHINRIAKIYPEIIYKCPQYNLNDILAKEAFHLPSLDLVISISEFEAQLCQWLGAKKSIWIPRSISPNPIQWQPIDGRVGFLGTLDHPPSMEGMVNILEELSRQKNSALRVRIISRSAWHGKLLSSRYSFVEYLGPKEGQVEAEVGTWCAFLNPMFCFARGCSTKLSVGLEWGIPCITTPSGARGYEVHKDSVIMTYSPSHFAQETVAHSMPAKAAQARLALLSSVPNMPSPQDISKRLATFLNKKEKLTNHTS